MEQRLMRDVTITGVILGIVALLLASIVAIPIVILLIAIFS